MPLLVGSDASNPWLSWAYVRDNADALLTAAVEHVWITVVSVAVAVLVAVPLAVLVRRYRLWQAPVLSIAGVLYTIPSLALILGLWPVLGLRPATVIVALAIYALLVILRNTIVGLETVPADVVDAAVGMGYGGRRLLWSVQLPLALPAILGGVRIATVSTVGLVTVGALVGHGGFGTLILAGFQNNFFHAQILTATVGTVLIALAFEAALVGLQRLLTPWARAARQAA